MKKGAPCDSASTYQFGLVTTKCIFGLWHHLILGWIAPCLLGLDSPFAK